MGWNNGTRSSRPSELTYLVRIDTVRGILQDVDDVTSDDVQGLEKNLLHLILVHQ